MVDLINEISKLALMKVNQVFPIYQEDDVTYLNRSVTGYAIAIPFKDERNINESFVGIKLSTGTLNFNGDNFKVIYLSMVDTGDIRKFSTIGAEFICVKNREGLLNDPYSWIDSWRELFGDTIKKYTITDVLSELIALKIIYKKDKTASWQGPKNGTHDIVTEHGVYEIKSTTHKTNSYVVINSAFQINTAINEKLIFVRLEQKPYAESIDKIVCELIDLGYDSNELESNLQEMGYSKGNRVRKNTFSILSINEYDVNESNFPIFTLNDLNNLTESKNIVGYTLTIDLSTKKGVSLN